MQKEHHANFIFDNGGNSLEGLKAVTEKPELAQKIVAAIMAKRAAAPAEAAEAAAAAKAAKEAK